MGSRLIALLGNFGDWTVVTCILGGFFLHPFHSLVFFVPVSSPPGWGWGGSLEIWGGRGGDLVHGSEEKVPQKREMKKKILAGVRHAGNFRRTKESQSHLLLLFVAISVVKCIGRFFYSPPFPRWSLSFLFLPKTLNLEGKEQERCFDPKPAAWLLQDFVAREILE